MKINALVKNSAKLSTSDANLKKKVISKNGKAIKWPNNGRLKAKGTYNITVTDKAGNKSTFKFKVK